MRVDADRKLITSRCLNISRTSWV